MCTSFAGPPPQTLHWATEAAALAEEHGYLYVSSFARALKGWALSKTGQPADGLILMGEAMAILDRIGASMDRPYLLALFSEITAASGRPSEALAQVTEALGLLRKNKSRTYFYEAELYRLRSALFFSRPAAARQRMKPKRISARRSKSLGSRKRGLSNCAPR